MQNALAVVEQQPIDGRQKLLGWINSRNIAEELDQNTLNKIGDRVVREYDIDLNSLADWRNKTEQAMDLAMQVAQEKQFPWPKAANVIFPLMTSAAMQFAARAYPAIIQNRNVVKGVVIGPDQGEPQIGPDGTPMVQQGPNGQIAPIWKTPPGGKQDRANRLGEHMSWQLLDEQPEWEPETDKMLHILPIVGCAFRKSYFDPGKGRNSSLMVSAMNLIINYHAKSLEIAPRLTEQLKLYPLEMEENERSGIFIEPHVPYGPAEDSGDDEDAPHEFLEQHRWWDLDEDGYPEPYIVTVHKTTRQVVRIVARYDADGIHISPISGKIIKIEPIQYYTQYDFLPNPDGGIYGIGFGQLLRPINEAVNTTLNQLLDAGTLQNTGGGFIGKGLSMNAGTIRFQMGEYKVVNVSGGDLASNIVPMRWPGPSPVLFNLLGLLVDAGKDVASVKDILTGDMAKSNTPATTTLALIEQGLKVFTAIYKRIHRSLKSELNKLYRLNRIYGDQESPYKVGDTWKVITKKDYQDGSGVEPVSDPTMVSDMQRLGRAQFLMQFAQDPWFKGGEIRKIMLEAASMENYIDRVMVDQPPPNPAVAVKGMELEQKGHKIESEARVDRAKEILYFAQAINQVAQADKAVGDQHLQWLNLQLNAWETQFEAATTVPKGEDGQAGGMPAAPEPPPMAHPVQMPMPMPSGEVVMPHRIGIGQ